MFLFAFFWASSHSSLAPTVEIGGIWPPKGIGVLDPREIPFLSTPILLSSEAAVTWAYHAILAGKEKRAAFKEWNIYEAPFTISNSIYGSTFFFATGFHGFHVIIGTLFLILCGIRKYLGHLTKEHHVAFEAAAWYWHFVDVELVSGLRNSSSKAKRIGLFQRITTAFPLPFIIIYHKVSSTFLPNLSLFWHINSGIEEIMADHVHQEMTRNWILVYLRLFLFISIKDLFLALISFPNKSKNLMDSSLPAMKDIHFSDSSTRSDYEMGKLSRVTLDFSSFYPTICLAYLKFFLVFFFSCPKIQDRLSCANEEGKAVFSWINSIYKGVKKSITFSLSFGPSCLQQGLQGLLPFHLSPLSSR
ncbi:hypothetical protein IC582_013225 [Cucumis melo]